MAIVTNLKDGHLIGHWKMNDNLPTTNVIDSSGYGNDGTAQQNTNVLTTGGKINTALSFDGIADEINCGHDSSLDITSAITISVWFRIDAFGGSQQDIVSKENYYRIMFYTGAAHKDLRSWLTIGGSPLYIRTNEVMSIDTWYHAVMTYDENGGADNWKLYINGVLKAFDTQVGPINSAPTKDIKIGHWGGYFDGKIDDVRIYDRALSEHEINVIYNEEFGTEEYNPICHKGLVISDILTKEANTCSFEIVESYADKPEEGEEIEVKLDGTKIFDGRIVSIESEKLSGNDFVFAIECVDWQCDLDKKMVVETYTGQTLYDIIDDINTKYLTGFTITNVENPGPTIDRIQFNYQYPSECFQEICDEYIGYDWYVDYDKDIHFFPLETNDAPIELLDNGTEFDELVINKDKTQVANRIWIRGGWYQSDQYTQDTITTIAGQTEFPINYYPHDFSVTVDGVPKTVGIEFVDPAGGHDFLMNANEKLLKVDTIVMAGGEAVIMKYDYEVPILCMVEDTTSQNIIKAIEGGDGVYEKYIVDQNIRTIEQARERGKAELLMYANPIIEGSFTSFQSGWRSGQRLHIDLTDRNIDEYYLVKEVEIECIGGDSLKYTVTIATTLQGFTWLMIKILDGLKDYIERTDEILDQLRTISDEEAFIADSVPTHDLIAPPFEYGPAGVPQGVYNESQYA